MARNFINGGDCDLFIRDSEGMKLLVDSENKRIERKWRREKSKTKRKPVRKIGF